jgi:hypothetical protein
MQEAPVECEMKWSFFNLTSENVEHEEVTFGTGFRSLLLRFFNGNGEASMAITSNPCCASQIALSPVPQPNSRALQGGMDVVVTVWIRLKSGLPMSQGASPTS